MQATCGWLGMCILLFCGVPACVVLGQASSQEMRLDWQVLPSLPNELGVAGPFVGVHENSLIVAGGANFPQPVWEHEKQWLDDIYVLRKVDDQYVWSSGGKLHQAVAYGANVSTPWGIVCIGGNNATVLFSACFLLTWDAQQQCVSQSALPSLPVPLAYGQACLIGNHVYVAGGQTSAELQSAVQRCWSLDLTHLSSQPARLRWREHGPWPGAPRAFNMVVAQHNGRDDCLYLIGGRYQTEQGIEFLSDCWEYNPTTDSWRARAAAPQALAAGTAVATGLSQVVVLSGDDGALFHRTDELRDNHPGFRRVTFAYQAQTNRWTELGESPANHVTTTAVAFDGAILLPTGEIRPRVRTPTVWKITSSFNPKF